MIVGVGCIALFLLLVVGVGVFTAVQAVRPHAVPVPLAGRDRRDGSLGAPVVFPIVFGLFAPC